MQIGLVTGHTTPISIILHCSTNSTRDMVEISSGGEDIDCLGKVKVNWNEACS